MLSVVVVLPCRQSEAPMVWERGADRVNVCYNADISDLWHRRSRGLPLRRADPGRDMLSEWQAGGGIVTEAATKGISEHNRQSDDSLGNGDSVESLFPKADRSLQRLA